MAKPSFEGNHLVQKMPEYFLLAGGISPSNTVISNLATDTEVPKLHAKLDLPVLVLPETVITSFYHTVTVW